MSDQFELSFRNKEVRIWIVIMVPAFIAEVLIMLFVGIQQPFITVLIPIMATMTFFVWRYLYRRKQKKDSSIV